MRSCLFSLVAINFLLLAGCGTHTETTESTPVPSAPIPILDSTHSPEIDSVEQSASPTLIPPEEPITTVEPSAILPDDLPKDDSSESTQETASAEESLQSIGRVLRETLFGSDDAQDSKGSVLESVGRALSKAVQETALKKSEEKE